MRERLQAAGLYLLVLLCATGAYVAPDLQKQNLTATIRASQSQTFHEATQTATREVQILIARSASEKD